MGHLPADVLLDIAENARPASSAPHLATCASCRQQVEEARRALALVSTMDVPEPSPLFWDHLSARVREAVAAEAPAPAPRVGWFPWRWAAAVSGAAAVFAVVLALTNNLVPSSSPDGGAGEPVASSVGQRLPLPADPSFSLIADLAGDLDWEGAAEAGFMVRSGVAEFAVVDLSVDERMELRRLLTEEIAANHEVL